MAQDNLARYKNLINSLITDYESIVRKENASGQFNINKSSEVFYEEFLSIILSKKIINANKNTSNAKGIDLMYESGEVVFQVTSNNSSTKIQETIKKVVAEIKTGKTYKELYMIMIVGKEEYPKADFSGHTENKFVFDKSLHILDNEDLLKKVRDNSIETHQKMYDCLEKYWGNKKINDLIKEPVKLNSLLNILVRALSQFHKIPNKAKNVHPNTVNKIKHNNLIKNAALIRKYSEYGSFVEETYNTLEENDSSGKEKVKNIINDTYLKAKGEIIGDGNIEEVRQNADAIFDKTMELLQIEVYKNLEEEDKINLNKEDLQTALRLIGAVGFVDCNILENPNDL